MRGYPRRPTARRFQRRVDARFSHFRHVLCTSMTNKTSRTTTTCIFSLEYLPNDTLNSAACSLSRVIFLLLVLHRLHLRRVVSRYDTAATIKKCPHKRIGRNKKSEETGLTRSLSSPPLSQRPSHAILKVDAFRIRPASRELSAGAQSVSHAHAFYAAPVLFPPRNRYRAFFASAKVHKRGDKKSNRGLQAEVYIFGNLFISIPSRS